MSKVIGHEKFINGKLVCSGKLYPTKSEENFNYIFKQTLKLAVKDKNIMNSWQKVGIDVEKAKRIINGDE